jgi:hypothetical protein
MMISTLASRGVSRDLSGRGDAVDSWHPDVHQYHVGTGAGYNSNCVTSVDSLANNLKIITVGQ